MGNAASQHHPSRSTSFDSSATTTPTRARPDAAQRRGSTPASAPATASDTHAIPDTEIDTEQFNQSLTSATRLHPLPTASPQTAPQPDDDDDDIVHTLPAKFQPTTSRTRHPLLIALDALPQTEPLSTTLDPPSIDQQPADSPYRIDRIQRVDARAVHELLRLCRQYVEDDVAELLTDQRDIARQLDVLEAAYSQLPATLRSMNDDIRALLYELNDSQQQHTTNTLGTFPSQRWHDC